MTFKIVLITSTVWLLVASSVFYIREKFLGGTSLFTDINSINDMNSLDAVLHETTTDSSQTTASIFLHRQPHWAYKLQFMQQPEDVKDRICFVHVGKTAGSTLACYLGFDYDHCATGPNTTYSVAIPWTSDIPSAYDTLKEMIPFGKLTNTTTSMIHRDSNSCIEDGPMSMYLFIVRNPLDRIKSWFLYERIDNTTIPEKDYEYKIKKPLFIDCGFTSLNILGNHPTKGLAAQNVSLCSRRAFRAISGVVGYSVHNKYNYGYYYKQVMYTMDYNNNNNNNNNINGNPRIVAIRNEHMEYDWNTIEIKILNGTSANKLSKNFTFATKNKSPKRYEDMFLDTIAKKYLCNALCEEIQIYKKILQQAENIHEKAYNKSMKELSMDCPHEVQIDDCNTSQ